MRKDGGGVGVTQVVLERELQLGIVQLGIV